MPIAAPSASRSGINQLLVCGTMGPDGGVCAEYGRRWPPGSVERRAVSRVNGGSDGEDFNGYVCTE